MAPRNTKISSFLFDGGLDLSTSPLSLKPGQLLWCKNYEIANTGGYRRVSGFEPVDGTKLPSDAEYTLVGFSEGLGFSVGDEVVGGVSGATAVVLEANADVDGELVVYQTSGVFSLDEYLQVGGVSKALVEEVFDPGSGDTDMEIFVARKFLAAKYVMSLIQEVPGAGPILGVWYYKDVVYAFRDSEDYSECRMYGSSAAGWQLISTPTLNPGGDYKFINYNFTGHAGTLKMFGCDGENKAFMFDGTTFTQLTTGMTNDTPKYITAHANHLFLAFSGGSVQHSAIADPTSWTAVLGAAELAVGDEVTGMKPAAGSTLVLFTRNTIQIIYGTDSSSWEMKSLSTSIGAVPGTIQIISAPVFVSDYGISILSQSDTFGDFQDNTVSLPVQKLIEANTKLIIGSAVLKGKNQYRIFFSTGEVLVMTFSGTNIKGYTLTDYNIPIRCTSSADRSDSAATDESEVFFGSDDGFVYKMDSGNSFAGETIQSILKIPPNHLGAPRLKKFFKLMILEVETEFGPSVKIYFKPDFTIMDSGIPESQQVDFTTSITGGDWDAAFWEEFYWDGEGEQRALYEIRPEGVGIGLGGQIYSESNGEEAHIIKSAIIHYSLRGVKR